MYAIIRTRRQIASHTVTYHRGTRLEARQTQESARLDAASAHSPSRHTQQPTWACSTSTGHVYTAALSGARQCPSSNTTRFVASHDSVVQALQAAPPLTSPESVAARAWQPMYSLPAQTRHLLARRVGAVHGAAAWHGGGGGGGAIRSSARCRASGPPWSGWACTRTRSSAAGRSRR